MNNFKVGCSPVTSEIYAGNVLKNGIWGNKKYNVTDSAVPSVAQYLLQKDVEFIFTFQGKEYSLKVEELTEK